MIVQSRARDGIYPESNLEMVVLQLFLTQGKTECVKTTEYTGIRYYTYEISWYNPPSEWSRLKLCFWSVGRLFCVSPIIMHNNYVTYIVAMWLHFSQLRQLLSVATMSSLALQLWVRVYNPALHIFPH